MVESAAAEHLRGGIEYLRAMPSLELAVERERPGTLQREALGGMDALIATGEGGGLPESDRATDQDVGGKRGIPAHLGVSEHEREAHVFKGIP
jgi:hypothetical protein